MKLPIEQIKLNQDNPRTITDEKFGKLVKSLKEFPEMAEVREIIVNKDHIVLGGNMRLRAMAAAGWKEVPVRVVDWPEEKQREFVAKDNASFGEWDWDALANEWDLKQLSEWGIDVPVDLSEEQAEVVEDEAPELPEDEPKSKKGEVYQLGQHRLMCGDSTNGDDVATLLSGTKADMVFTDPPYGVSYTGVAGSKNWKMIENDDLRDDGLVRFLVAAFLNAHEHSTTEAGLYCWFSSKNNMEFTTALKATNWEVKQELIWNKGMSLSGADYQYAHEPVLYCQKWGEKAQWYGGRDKKSILRQRRTDIAKIAKSDLVKMFQAMQNESTVWEIDRDLVTTYQHPTQKPATLAGRAICNSTEAGASVLDLFGGSGSTLSACEQLGRTSYTMEFDPKYCDVIRKRYAKLLGNEDEWETITAPSNKMEIT